MEEKKIGEVEEEKSREDKKEKRKRWGKDMRRCGERVEKGRQAGVTRDEKNETICSLSLTLWQKSAVHKICFNQAILLEDSKYWKITIFI
jgi:hypothetical protein